MTRKDNRDQQAWHRLNHSRWHREPSIAVDIAFIVAGAIATLILIWVLLNF